MNFNVRPFTPEQDYEDLISWWIARKWTPVPLENLPQLGLVVETEKEKCCAGFVYRTDSQLCFLEFIVASPTISTELRSLSVDLIIEKLCDESKAAGFSVIFSSSVNESLTKRFLKQEFKLADTNVTHIVRKV